MKGKTAIDLSRWNVRSDNFDTVLSSARSGVRTIPYRVMSKNHESVSATGKPSTISDNDKTDRPIGNVEYRKNLGDALSQRPAAHNIRDCDAINSSSLQFRKKVFQLHGSIGLGSKPPICFSVGNGNFEIRSQSQSDSLAIGLRRRVVLDQLLKTRIVADRIPFPAMFQIVDGDAVIGAINCPWRSEQTLDQRNSQIIFTDPSIDEREIAIHE